jgi:hypothetical protein
MKGKMLFGVALAGSVLMVAVKILMLTIGWWLLC